MHHPRAKFTTIYRETCVSFGNFLWKFSGKVVLLPNCIYRMPKELSCNFVGGKNKGTVELKFLNRGRGVGLQAVNPP